MPPEFHPIGWRGDCIVPCIELQDGLKDLLRGVLVELRRRDPQVT
jgi:hypothetical protein